MCHVLGLLALSLSLLTSVWAAEQPTLGQAGKVPFWIGTDANGVFDEQTLRYIADRAGIVLLNARVEGPAPSYEYPAIVRRLHELRPGLPVLMYTWASRWSTGPRVGSVTLAGYQELGPLLIRGATGEVVEQKKGLRAYRRPPRDDAGRNVAAEGDDDDDPKVIYGDVRQEKYRSWFVEQVEKMLARTGTDGVGLDVVIRTPADRPKVLASLCKKDPKYCADYARGLDSLFTLLKSRLPAGKILFYNGLFAKSPGMLEDQRKLLAYADATAVEYFGMTPNKGVLPAEQGIFSYLKIAQQTPNKSLLFFGRGSWKYADYQEDYLWQRYLYCAYLLAAGPKTMFKYHSSFQIPPHAGRSGGLDTYADWAVELGPPLDPYKQQGSLYLRRFAEGLVLVVPHDSKEARYALPNTMFTPEGERLNGTITVKPGRGFLLLTKEPKPASPVRKSYEPSPQAKMSWRWADLRTEGNDKHFLRVERTPKNQEWEHDLMLDAVRSLAPPSRVRLQLRTTDPQATLQFVAEVDDAQKEHTQLMVEVWADAGTPQGLTMTPAIPFRVADSAGKMPAIRTEATLQPDGKWHPIVLRGDKALKDTKRYVFRRWSHVRLIGNLEIDDVELQSSE